MKPKLFFTFGSIFIRFFKKYEQIGTFCFIIYSVRNLSFICIVFRLSSEKNASFRLSCLKKYCFPLKNVYFRSKLWIRNIKVFVCVQDPARQAPDCHQNPPGEWRTWRVSESDCQMGYVFNHLTDLCAKITICCWNILY